MKQKIKRHGSGSGIVLMLAILFSSFSAISLEAQERITGIVSGADGMPLPGVNVLQKGTSNGAVTDFDGEYSIKLSAGPKTLVFSYLGFQPQEINVGNQTTLNVILEEDVASLDEVVIVGYGTQKKESVVGAITQVKGGDLMERAAGIANVEEALQGNLPGVTAIQGSGTPGESNMKIFIRGRSSWNGEGGPLILVDGVKRSMTDIDMNDIEKLSVLKDASATAVFGVEGANGVILITTKRGQAGKAQLSLNVNTTIKTVSQLPEKLNSYDALRQANSSILREIAVAPNSWGDFTPLAILDKYRNPASLEESYIYPNVNWEDELLKDYAQDYRINLSVRGGNKTAKYFGSLAYQTVDDIFDGGKYDNGRGYLGEYNYERFNFRTNIDFNITSTTELSVNLSGFLGIRENPSSVSNVINGVYQIAPSLYTPVYPDGLYGQSINSAFIFNNPIVNLSASGYDTFTNFQVNTDFILKQKLDFITEGLSFQGRFSLDNNMRSKQSLNDGGVSYRFYDGDLEQFNIPNSETRFDYVQAPWTLGTSEVENSQRSRQMVYDFSFNYNKSIGEKHNLTALFLARRQQSATGSQFPRYREDWVGRLTYNYDLRYFLDVNGAYNGSEKFGPGFRFDLFPSVALGWTVSNEAFMENVDWVNLLKFRGSYGIVGDDNSDGRFQYITQWANGGPVFGSAFLVPSAFQGDAARSPYVFYREDLVGNPNLQWESAVKYNVGAEVSLFNGLLTGEFDYFAEDRDNIVVLGNALSVPDFFGATPPPLNVGVVEVRGFEVVLGANYTFNNDINIFGDFNYTQAIDKVIARDDPLFRPDYQKFAGYPIGQSRTAIPAGILTNWDDVYMSTPKNTDQSFTRVGYYDVVDFDGDGIYNSNFDNAPFGYPEQPQRNWSATLGARYKGFSISAQLYGTQNASRRFSNNTFTQQTPLIFKQDLDYWTVDTPNNTDTQPSWQANGATNPRDNWLDGSLTRLKAVSLSYDIPKKTCEKLGLKQLQVFANGNNLFLWSDLPDDREFNTSSDAQARGDYPTLKRFNFGFNMNF
ncbi:TonB-dependent receptor [Algibacter amylolyticus]|uniref:TonB-dependent receptor n=1 Tax=Algibacter amylolyticus TaxID=1608400 RepID=A0A5M7B6C4_9FLAO|nr:TonB-dependent receptor [Algibacter amylolyticus]KAA5824859.1 TonB-dependent receptor [Algibacter amylolyticus]MBB5268986.1 TonB-linked SusC/RagA family outer membrane protein [Algibacter amylolyticus]TSJ76024.1 TonB-dependent receptor [Algibacter amylolyticus]